MTTVAIIGTAGRSDEHKYDINLYNKMIEVARKTITDKFKLDPKNITIVSGGAALSDHIAVDLFLSNFCDKGIRYLPAKWNHGTNKYVEMDNKYDPGRISNYYHSLFSKKTGKNSLKDIQEAINKGINIDQDGNGFKERNSKIAKADYVIAFSFDNTNGPSTGGTADTWSKSKTSNKIHIQLQKL